MKTTESNSDKVALFIAIVAILAILIGLKMLSDGKIGENSKILYIIEYNCSAKDAEGNPIQLYAGEEVKLLNRNFFKDSEIYCLRRGLNVFIRDTKLLRKANKEEEDAYYQYKNSEDIWYEAIRQGVLNSKEEEN